MVRLLKRRTVIKLLAAAGVAGAAHGVGTLSQTYLGGPLADGVETLQRFGKTLDDLASLVGSANSIEQLRIVKDKFPRDDNIYSSKVLDTYSSIVDAYDASRATVTAWDKALSAIRTGQIPLGDIGRKGTDLGSKIPGKEALDDMIIRMWKWALPDASQERGTTDLERYKARAEKIGVFENALKDLKVTQSEYDTLTLHLHNTYVINKDKTLNEREGSLDLMKKVSTSYLDGLNLMKELEKGGHTTVPTYLKQLQDYNKKRDALVKEAASHYNYETFETRLGKTREQVERSSYWIGAIPTTALGWLFAYKPLAKLINWGASAKDTYDKRRGR